MENTEDILRPTTRFTNRVGNYTKYRPGYPEEIKQLLRRKLPPGPDAVVADIGSGTGIFSELLLNSGYNVYCVEPNEAMQSEAERRLSRHVGFKPVRGRAEQTNLPENSVGLVTCAQAFHWFDAPTAKEEFKRILKPGAGIALLWNLRVNDAPQMAAYEQLKKDFGVDYLLAKRADEAAIKEFFGDGLLTVHAFANNQLLDFASLKGQLLSASYMPIEGQQGYGGMVALLEDIFNKYNKNGLLEIVQQTKVYVNW